VCGLKSLPPAGVCWTKCRKYGKPASTDLQIRQAISSDVEPLIDLQRRTISASYRSFLGDESVDGFVNSGAIDTYVMENLERCVVITGNSKIVGCCVTKDNLIDLLMIHHEHHRSGLGTLLLRHVEDTLFRRHDELILESFANNRQAFDFYRKSGWSQVRAFRDPSSGHDKLVFVLRRAITTSN